MRLLLLLCAFALSGCVSDFPAPDGTVTESGADDALPAATPFSFEGRINTMACLPAPDSPTDSCIAPLAELGDRATQVRPRHNVTAIVSTLEWDAQTPLSEVLRLWIHCDAPACEDGPFMAEGPSPLALDTEGLDLPRGTAVTLWVSAPNPTESVNMYTLVEDGTSFLLTGELLE